MDLPALARTCLKLYKDAIPICYAVNTFKLAVGGSHNTFVKEWILHGTSSSNKRNNQDIVLAFNVGFDPDFRDQEKALGRRLSCNIHVKTSGHGGAKLQPDE